LSPIYWKVLQSIPAFEIILHRVVWSFFFLIPLLLIQGRWHDFLAALKNRVILVVLFSTACFVGLNWFIYIWAVNHDHILQASLGYYISPLVNILLGMLFLKERLRPLQILAVLLATLGVLQLTIYYGEFPWISLALAFSFGFYGLVRKVAPVGSLEGLTVETLLLGVPAVIYLLKLDANGVGSFLRVSLQIDAFLVGTALVTALPLLLFTIGTRRLNLSTIGFLQYVAPSCMFLLAVFFFHEPIEKVQVQTFALVWVALIIYSTDSAVRYRRRAHP
ncbi:EamA family transporter RarD, partial [Thermodesulfobacteriota bacterium]